jgi:hypothetical protein
VGNGASNDEKFHGECVSEGVRVVVPFAVSRDRSVGRRVCSVGSWMGGRQRCRRDPVTRGLGMTRSRRRVVRRWWTCLIGQVDGEDEDPFFGKGGKPRFSCSGVHFDHSGGREFGILVI